MTCFYSAVAMVAACHFCCLWQRLSRLRKRTDHHRFQTHAELSDGAKITLLFLFSATSPLFCPTPLWSGAPESGGVTRMLLRVITQHFRLDCLCCQTNVHMNGQTHGHPPVSGKSLLLHFNQCKNTGSWSKLHYCPINCRPDQRRRSRSKQTIRKTLWHNDVRDLDQNKRKH